MFTDLKPYPEYADSGQPWFGPIPASWRACGARILFAEVKSPGHEDAEMLSVTIGRGVIRQSDLLTGSSKKDSSNLDKSKYKLVEPGDIAYNKMRAWQGAVGLSQHRGIVSPAYIVIRPRQGSGAYFHHLLRTPSFAKEAERWSYGISSDQWSLRPEHFKMIYLPFPPDAEQEAIVKYLGHANARIDRAIAAKRKLIALLEEQKQAVINQAVTRGIDPNIPMKQSGIDWIGEVPEHWLVGRLKNAANIRRGRFTARPRNDPTLYDGPYPFIQTGSIARADRYVTSYEQTLNDEGLAVSELFPSGTLVMAIAANIGDVAILGFDTCIPDSIISIVPRAALDPAYLYFLLRSLKRELESMAPVNTQGNLSVERVASLPMPIPPHSEQRVIARHIEAKTTRICSAIRRARREIELLQEFRTRLTADVVTGQLDVRAAAARLPELDPADLVGAVIGPDDEDLDAELAEGLDEVNA